MNYSVIIPHYNSFQLLQNLLSSLPKRDDIEIIVIDDNSTHEGYNEIKQKNENSEIKFLSNTEGKGAGVCRNIGLSVAKGKWVLFFDADDFMINNSFIHIDSAILSVDKNVDIIYFKTKSQYIGSEEPALRHVKINGLVHGYIEDKNEVSEAKLRLTHNVPWGKVIRHSLIKSRGAFFDATIVANDGIFSLKVGRYARKIIAIDSCYYCVTQGTSTLTTTKNLVHYKVRLSVYVRYFNYLTERERYLIEVSPIPIVLSSLKYGVFCFFWTARYVINNKISFFKYLKFNKSAFKRIGLFKNNK